MSYEHITWYDPGCGSRRDSWAEIIDEGETLLLYWKVDKKGERYGKHLVSKDLIRARVPAAMNLHYGELEKRTI